MRTWHLLWGMGRGINSFNTIGIMLLVVSMDQIHHPQSRLRPTRNQGSSRTMMNYSNKKHNLSIHHLITKIRSRHQALK
jgi:hypothetical protein